MSHQAAAGTNAIPPRGLQSDIMERAVVRRYRNELASIWRLSRDVTREYDEVTASWLPGTCAQESLRCHYEAAACAECCRHRLDTHGADAQQCEQTAGGVF